MSMEITRLHGTTSADLLAIPVIMLGFHPRESCVVLGVLGTRVEFCARMDLDWFTSGFSFGKVAEQLENAVDACDGCSVAVLAYTSDPEAGAIAVEELVAVVGQDIVCEALVTDGDRFWYSHPGVLIPPDGIAYCYASSSFAAQAVFSGVNVTVNREAAVAEVQPPTAAELPAVALAITAAAERVAALDVEGRWALLERHMTTTDPLGPMAGEVAVLLQDVDHFGAVLAQLNVGTSEHIRPRLAEVRRWSPETLAGNVVALLAMACWLDGEGAQQSDCLSQLEALDRHHPLLGVLAELHHMAIPPSRWDS